MEKNSTDSTKQTGDNVSVCSLESSEDEGLYKLFTFYWSTCTKPGEWLVIYTGVRCVDVPHSTIFRLDIGTVSTVWYLLFTNLLLSVLWFCLIDWFGKNLFHLMTDELLKQKA
jgi:hypothetical protein